MYLFFDTETTGLPKNYKAPASDLNNWPRLVQLAYHLYDNDGNKISEGDHINESPRRKRTGYLKVP